MPLNKSCFTGALRVVSNSLPLVDIVNIFGEALDSYQHKLIYKGSLNNEIGRIIIEPRAKSFDKADGILEEFSRLFSIIGEVFSCSQSMGLAFDMCVMVEFEGEKNRFDISSCLLKQLTDANINLVFSVYAQSEL